jgi:hypothetical protein
MGRSQVLGLVIYTVFCFALTMPLVTSISGSAKPLVLAGLPLQLFL